MISRVTCYVFLFFFKNEMAFCFFFFSRNNWLILLKKTTGFWKGIGFKVFSFFFFWKKKFFCSFCFSFVFFWFFFFFFKYLSKHGWVMSYIKGRLREGSRTRYTEFKNWHNMLSRSMKISYIHLIIIVNELTSMPHYIPWGKETPTKDNVNVASSI